MSGSQHRCAPLALRVFVLGLLALGLVIKPVLASIGELHELAHDPTGTHAPVTYLDTVADASHDDEPSEGGTDPLHVLMHVAHCCCQSSLASLTPLLVVSALPSADVLQMSELQDLPRTFSLAPFRPPITA